MKKYHRCCVMLLLGVVLLPLPRLYAQSQLWVERPRADCPPDPVAAWRRGYIEGYTQSPSIAQGQMVKFKVSTLAAYTPRGQVTSVPCAMRIYRAVGRRLANDIDMQMYRTFQATFYPLRDSVDQPIWPDEPHTRFPRDYRRGCDDLWATADSFQIPSTNWPSGFYYAKLFLLGQEQDSVGYIPFVVRAAVPGSSSKTLCVIAWNTYQAYNYWGGGSLYWWTGFGGGYDTNRLGQGRVRTVSFRRPFTVHNHCGQWPATRQIGQFEMPYEDPNLGLALWNTIERSFVSWAYEAGDTMEFCVDADINAAFEQGGMNLNSYRAIVFPGHSEYWSKPQRDNIEKNIAHTSFKENGGNIAFFAANTCYWKVDYKPNAVGNNPDSMFCDKDDSDIHGGAYLWRRQTDTTTGQFQHEARLLGVEFLGTNDPGGGEHSNVVKKQDHWTFRGTSLQNGSRFGLGNHDNPYIAPVASGEVDRSIPNFSPSNIEILAREFIRQLTDTAEAHYGEVDGDSLYSDCTLYEDMATNSRVFAGGGNGWTPCLFGQDSVRMRTITSNVLDHFSGKRYIGNIYRNLTWSPEQLLRDTVEIDGDSRVISTRQLLLGNGMKVIIDSAVALFVDGEVQIPTGSNVTIGGLNNKWGNLVIDSAGTLRVKSGATLNLVAPLYFVLETGSNLVLESGATLNIRTITSVGSDVTATAPSGATVRIDQHGEMYFGSGAGLSISGTLIAQGTSGDPVTLSHLPETDYWSGITLNEESDASFNYCDILHAQVGINANTVIPTIDNTMVDSCKIGVSMFLSAGTITNSIFTHNIIKGLIIDGENPNIDEVASLVDEDRPAGYHQVSFDGGRFSSGVYFYRMEAGGFASVKKLLLLK